MNPNYRRDSPNMGHLKPTSIAVDEMFVPTAGPPGQVLPGT